MNRIILTALALGYVVSNLQDPRYVDTVDLSLNPLTKRLEIVRSERHNMELSLWSIDPAGAVIDEKRGVQHVFIYTGHPNGPAGVYRITRTLNTPKLKSILDDTK